MDIHEIARLVLILAILSAVTQIIYFYKKTRK